MLKIILDINKSVEQNAAVYFEKAKKAKKKLAGALEMLEKAKQQREKAVQVAAEEAVQEKQAPKRKPQWYEKFRWFISSEGFLVIGGRDATSNEIVIKKHTDKEDLVFHTDMAGSPFFVVKRDSQKNKKIGEATIQEVADATCTFSRAWKLGLQTIKVFWVKPDQVSKQTQAGEYMPKGAFMIRGKTNYVPARMNFSIGMTEKGEIMAGPLTAVTKHCKRVVKIVQGKDKTSDLAKKIKRIIGSGLDEIIRALPAGGGRIVT